MSPNKITDTQLVLLSAAAQRDDGAIDIAENPKRGPVKKRQFGALCTQSDASNSDPSSVDCIINTSGLLPVSLGMKILLSS